jgi:hypothetical protein
MAGAVGAVGEGEGVGGGAGEVWGWEVGSGRMTTGVSFANTTAVTVRDRPANTAKAHTNVEVLITERAGVDEGPAAEPSGLRSDAKVMPVLTVAAAAPRTAAYLAAWSTPAISRTSVIAMIRPTMTSHTAPWT